VPHAPATDGGGEVLLLVHAHGPLGPDVPSILPSPAGGSRGPNVTDGRRNRTHVPFGTKEESWSTRRRSTSPQTRPGPGRC
jgi:hypothetical protein